MKYNPILNDFKDEREYSKTIEKEKIGKMQDQLKYLVLSFLLSKTTTNTMFSTTSLTSTPPLWLPKVRKINLLLRNIGKNNTKNQPTIITILLTIPHFRGSISRREILSMRKNMKGKFTIKTAEYTTSSMEAFKTKRAMAVELVLLVLATAVWMAHRYSATTTLSLENTIEMIEKIDPKVNSSIKAWTKAKDMRKDCLLPTATRSQCSSILNFQFLQWFSSWIKRANYQRKDTSKNIKLNHKLEWETTMMISRGSKWQKIESLDIRCLRQKLDSSTLLTAITNTIFPELKDFTDSNSFY